MEFVSDEAGRPISAAAYAAAARLLDCDVAAVQAVAQVESRRDPFAPCGRPTVLFERHKFRRYTAGRFDDSHPGLSGPRGGYGRHAEQWDRLTAAIALDREAALKSASWGAFQIMGFNHAACGFDEVEDFAAAMAESADRHLDAFVGFVIANGLDRPLRALDWARFARGYNGPAFRDNDYDAKIARAYAAFATADAPAQTPTPRAAADAALRIRSVADMQRALAYLSLDPGPVDNRMGPKTAAAIRRLQRFALLEETGRFCAEARAAAQSAFHLMRRLDALDAGAARP